MILDLLKSKRVWVVILSVVAVVLAKSGYIVDSAGQEMLADAIIGAISAALVVITKVIDIKNSKQ